MSDDLFGWRHCAGCDEDWPPECFDAEREMCRACAHENPRRVRRPCSSCGRKVETLDRVAAPQCRPCRRSRANLSIPHRRARKRRYDRRRYQRTVAARANRGERAA